MPEPGIVEEFMLTFFISVPCLCVLKVAKIRKKYAEFLLYFDLKAEKGTADMSSEYIFQLLVLTPWVYIYECAFNSF